MRGLRGLQGTRRGSPRAPPLARAQSVSVVGNVGAGGGVGTRGPPASRCWLLATGSPWSEGFVVPSPPRTGALRYCSSRTGGKVEPGSGCSVWAAPVCVLRGPEQWAGGDNGKQSGRTFKTPTVSPASACLCPCGWSVHCLKFNCFFILSGHAVYHSLCLKSGSRGSDRSMAIRQQNTALLLSDSAAALFSPPTSHLRASTDLAILTVLPFPES